MMRGCLATQASKVGGAGAWLLLLHTIAHNRTGQYWLKPRADTATRNGFGRCLKGFKANMRTLREAGLLVSVQPVRPGYAVDAVSLARRKHWLTASTCQPSTAKRCAWR